MRLLLVCLILLVAAGPVSAADGVTDVSSSKAVKETTDKLISVLKSKGMTVILRVDHAAAAENAGLELRPTELVVFGNPKVGTPLMQCQQSVALDLPQKALIWEDENGDVWLSYNDPAYLSSRHEIEGCEPVLEKITNALSNFANAATAP